MSPGSNTESYPAFAHIGLRENPRKNLNQVTCPDRESNPGHLVSRPDALTVTPQELAEVHFMYGKTNGKPALGRRLYQERYPDRWIGRGGPIVWPPRSPDLNPIDFYLWGHLKSLMYSSPVPDMESLRNRIVAGCEEICNTPGIWDLVYRVMRHRCEVCIQAGGGHFEHLL
ncbi:hypothetical protein ANN_14509 [Periplaneta americana]|uniref:Uncharacterized protein n=1 Tax=Periplaneta americana TaxID=6978 RepID=A0ABQ8SXZ9_PERAM|nr:hypothetical protein ANN_14509 [Periplaneta americana]